MTVRGVCESYGINVYCCFANALNWAASQERQAIVAEDAKKEEARLSDL